MASIQHTDSTPQLTTRTIVAGIAFIGASLTFLVTAFMPIVDFDAPATALATIASNPDTFLYTCLLDILYAVLLVPALLGAASLPRGRGATLTYFGAGLALVGNLGHTFIAAVELVARNMALPAADRAEMIALLTRLTNDAGLIIVLPMMLSFVVGSVLVAAGLWRARLISAWPVALMFAAASLDFLPLGIAGDIGKTLAGTAASLWIGVALIRLAYAGRASAAERAALAVQPQGG